MRIYIDSTLLAMPQVRSITEQICDDTVFFSTKSNYCAEEQGGAWTLTWGYPTTKRRFGVAETGFFWDAMHIDMQGLYQFSSLNSVQGNREIREYRPPESAIELIKRAPIPKSKYRQPQDEIEWKDVVFACQNPSDRSIHSVASTEDWWRFYEDSCRFYGSKLFVKLHPWNRNEIKQQIEKIASRYKCEVGYAGHSVVEQCDHVVLFNSTFSIDCMVRGIPVKQGAPGYFGQTGAVTYCAGNPKIDLDETEDKALSLVNFLVWRYCFSMDCNLSDWKKRLRSFAQSRKLFPLEESESYGAYLLAKCKQNTGVDEVDRQELEEKAIVDGESIKIATTKSKRRIFSFCTTCMGRLRYLCQTLPKNLEANRHFYPDIEFILLDYNSQDGLREWVKTAVWEYVKSGLLTVYSTLEPQLYHSAHAKNLAHRLSRGQIVCNLDADNYLLPEYVEYIWNQLDKDANTIFFGQGRDATGKVTLLREHFYQVCGYNEEMRGYGYDDVDLIGRASRHLSLRKHQDKKFNKFIRHTHAERIQNMEFESIDESNLLNKKIMRRGLDSGNYIVNQGKSWGKSVIQKNYIGKPFSNLVPTDAEINPLNLSTAEDHGIFTPSVMQSQSHHDTGLLEGLIEVLPTNKPVLDIGCGVGSYLASLKDKGFECLGIEGQPNVREYSLFQNIITHDLCTPFEIDVPRSTVLCLEVAEHVPSEYENQLLSTIDVCCSEFLVMSWAFPGQAGVGHINCRPFSYVVQRFNSLGFVVNKGKTQLLRTRSTKWWFKRNVTVFERCSNRIMNG